MKIVKHGNTVINKKCPECGRKIIIEDMRN